MKRYYLLILLFVQINMLTTVNAQQKWTPSSSKNWAENREWANGSKLLLSPATNDIEFATQYHMNKSWWDQAFAFLNDKKLDTLKPGKYIIDGDNVYAMVTEGPLKDSDKV